MDIEAVIAALLDRYTPDKVAIIEEHLRNHHGTVPDQQLLSETGLAVAIHRRQQMR